MVWGYVWRYGYEKDGEKVLFLIQVVKCRGCGKKHRVLPPCLLPHKRYKAEVVAEAIERGSMTEDCVAEEGTQRLWISWFRHIRQLLELQLQTDSPSIAGSGACLRLPDFIKAHPRRSGTADNWLSRLMHRFVVSHDGKPPPSLYERSVA